MKALKSLFPLLLILLIGAVFLNYHFLLDTLSTLHYSAPSEISSLEQQLDLTSSGQLIFRASHPALEDRSNFNEHCKSHNVEISILGCYSSQSIYIYNISEPDLDGIVQSTAAHELLHGAWDRLNIFEQASLKPEIESFYNAHPELSEELEDYPADELLDELHSRIGTEYAELPATLESHYARYFQDQDAIVAYYDQYSAKFLTLRAQISELDTDIDEAKAVVGQMRSTYHSRLDALNSAIDEFNTCASTPNCFTESQFNTQRAALLSEQDELEEYYNQLNVTINSYNELVDQYNNNVLRSRTLENAVNSNAQPIEKL